MTREIWTHLSTDETSEGRSDDGTFGRNLGESSGEEVDVLDVVLVSPAKDLDGARAHGVIKVGPALDLRQPAELAPLGVS